MLNQRGNVTGSLGKRGGGVKEVGAESTCSCDGVNSPGSGW